ncbi:MAG: biotin/lipoyl-binding protein [Eubacteriales bacterium]|nr:biotin/lipoyl-binding protein [Eubacteriales bacterium]
MKKYVVKVNGNEYEVEVEEIKNDGSGFDVKSIKPSVAPAAVKAAPVPAPASAQAPKTSANPAPSNAAPAPAGSRTIDAPMPGTILKINVKPGDSIKKGDLLVVLEAMKMENDIVSPFDGRIAGIHTQTGASVNTGDALVSFE